MDRPHLPGWRLPHPLTDFDNPPSGKLCKVTYNNGLGTTGFTGLYYKYGQLTRIQNPDNERIDFGFDDLGRMWLIRDALQSDILMANLIEKTVSLRGGVLYTKRTSGTHTWSHPNVHGDIILTTNSSGGTTGGPYRYDPYGQPLNSLPDNSAGNLDYGWLGQHQRPVETQAGNHMIEMGARVYSACLGRFLHVDPIEGGSANDYDYVYAEPCNTYDLDGRIAVVPIIIAAARVYGYANAAYNAYKCQQAVRGGIRLKNNLKRYLFIARQRCRTRSDVSAYASERLLP